jgi:hypothetical protein
LPNIQGSGRLQALQNGPGHQIFCLRTAVQRARKIEAIFIPLMGINPAFPEPKPGVTGPPNRWVFQARFRQFAKESRSTAVNTRKSPSIRPPRPGTSSDSVPTS